MGEGFCSDFSLPHCHHHGPQGSDPYPAEGAPGCPSATSPQCPRECDASAKAPHNDFENDKIGFEGEVLQVSGADNIARAIMEGGPVETAFTVYSDFANYSSGIYHHTTGSQLGGHAVRIVGWGVENGEKYWKVANSWNPYWGEKGYFRIRRGINDCGIEDMVTASSATAKWGKKASKTVSEESLAPLKALLGVTSEAMEDRAKFAQTARLSQTQVSVEIPENFDSATNWPACAKVINDIRDQSNCGCCWAFAAAEAASDRLCIATKAAFAVPLSAQDVCFCASENGCGGGDIVSPWDFIKKGAVTGGQYKGSGPMGEGFCSDFSLPHCHHHGPQGSDPYPAEGAPGCPSASSPQCPTTCDASAKAPHNDFTSDKIGFQGDVLQVSGADNIAQAIMEGGPVETAFTVYSDFANYSQGIYHHTEGSQLGGHAVRIVGWGVENGIKYWKVANSWNPYWGEKGYFRIRRGINDCGIEDMVTASSSSAKWGKQMGDMTVVV
jgi:cathepsin B